jgi:WD40 repeat protein
MLSTKGHRTTAMALFFFPIVAFADRAYSISDELKRDMPAVGREACSISSSGALVAYCAEHCSTENSKTALSATRETEVRVLSGDLFAPVYSSETYDDAFAASWAPNSEKCAFAARRSSQWYICIYDATISKTVEFPLPGSVPKDATLGWSKDDRELLLAISFETDIRGNSAHLGNEDTSANPNSNGHCSSFGLLELNAQTGLLDAAIRTKGKVSCISFSPNGSQIAYLVPGELHVFDLLRKYDAIVSAGAHSGLTAFSPCSFSWSPSGSALAYISQPERAIWVVRIDQKEASKLVSVPPGTYDPDLVIHDAYTAPAWLGNPERIAAVLWGHILVVDPANPQNRKEIALPKYSVLDFLQRRGSSELTPGSSGPHPSFLVAVLNTDDLSTGFASVDLDTGGFQRLIAENTATFRRRLGCFYTDVSRQAERIVAIYETDDQPPRLELFSKGLIGKHLADCPVAQEFHFRPAIRIRYLTGNGETLDGTLLLPDDKIFHAPFPLVVLPFPGVSEGYRHIHDFGIGGRGVENAQLYAAVGYAVFRPGMHASLDECDRDVIPALLKLAESGVVDPKRMTVVGFGHGAPFAIELMISSGILRNGCVAGGSLAALLSPELLLRGASYVNLERMKAPLLIVGPSDFVSNPSTQVILDFLRRLKRSPRYLDFGSGFESLPLRQFSL